MASYHLQINTGGKGDAVEHAQYIQREGRFTEEKYGEVAARGSANMPEWAREDVSAFWKASDKYERANGNTYREFEVALPRELSREQQIALVQRFAEQELGSARPYQWVIHTPLAADRKEQPHVHVMFSDRQQDGLERGPEQFFKRYNAKTPERGGARKMSYGDTKEEAALAYKGIRARWGDVQNLALEQAGVEARVDHRSLRDQGIWDREPEVHRGPAVSGIEARGEVSVVGERQRSQREGREFAREAVGWEVKRMTREELAIIKGAVRERRDLAAEVTGKDRTLVLKAVEADRREQLGRTGAMAERRVERRQSLGGRMGQKLLGQARALRERLGQQLGRVREWVRERFPEPFKHLQERTREFFGVAPEPAAAPLRPAVPLDWEAIKAGGRAASEGWRQTLHHAQAETKRAEQVRQEQQRQRQAEAERAERERQAQAERRAGEQAERERTVEQFQDLAANRERQRFGYGDQSENWRATPAALRMTIDQYNALVPPARMLVLERLAEESTAGRTLEQLQQLMDQREKSVKALDRDNDYTLEH